MKGWLVRGVQTLAGLAVLAAAVAWLSGGCGERIPPGRLEAPGEPVPEGASTAAVELVTGPALEWTSGQVASARRTAVASRILARIEAVPVRAGDEVEAGDVLVRLDARDLGARVEEAREALQAARARLELARREAERAEELFREGVGTRQRLDRTRSELRVAEAELEGRAQALSEARTALSHAEIRAPVAGRVVDRLAEPGDTAVPGQPLLRLYDPRALRVEVPVRESLAVALSVGDTLRVEVPAAELAARGTIDEIVPFAEPGARTLLVKVRLPHDPDVFAGLFARVAVPAGERRTLSIPAAAVARVGQLEFATVVGPEGRAERRLVTTGSALGPGRVEVLSGLAPGERVHVPPAAAEATSGSPEAAQGPAGGPSSRS